MTTQQQTAPALTAAEREAMRARASESIFTGQRTRDHATVVNLRADVLALLAALEAAKARLALLERVAEAAGALDAIEHEKVSAHRMASWFARVDRARAELHAALAAAAEAQR